MLSESRAVEFYTHIISKQYHSDKFNNLISRVKYVCLDWNITLTRYIFNDDYFNQQRRILQNVYKKGTDGLTDSVIQILNSDQYFYKKDMLKMLLMPF